MVQSEIMLKPFCFSFKKALSSQTIIHFNSFYRLSFLVEAQLSKWLLFNLSFSSSSSFFGNFANLFSFFRFPLILFSFLGLLISDSFVWSDTHKNRTTERSAKINNKTHACISSRNLCLCLCTTNH